MTNEQFEREMRYRVSMAVANSMLRKGLISQAEHDAFDALMIEKYRPPIGSILLKTSVDKAPDES
ncbi:MAG TPA: SHOCT domain-containing protein [Clostridia bacterium]|nr:SHOCT domain-containing protein [Clostridia bacterium]